VVPDTWSGERWCLLLERQRKDLSEHGLCSLTVVWSWVRPGQRRGGGRRPVDDDDVAGLRKIEGAVDVEVVARASPHGERGPVRRAPVHIGTRPEATPNRSW